MVRAGGPAPAARRLRPRRADGGAARRRSAALEAGADANALRALAGDEDPGGDLALDDDERMACELFTLTLTQWRHPPHGPPSGIDYAALPAAAALAGLEVGPGAFRCLRTMEGTVVAALRRRAEAAR